MALDYFAEEHSKTLLSKEWLVKADTERSIPYLMKFHASLADQTCVLMITDTKTVWAEVLSSKQLSRRWYDLNPASSPSQYPPPPDAHEDWLDQVLQYVSDAHTLGGMDELSFDITDTQYSDLAVEVRGDAFKWRWETFLLGPKFSAEVLSRHLIQPLISTVYLAFTSADPVGEMSEGDLEKAADKVGRTARRSGDTHLKNAVMRPRVSTTLRRITALFDFNPTLPRILSETDRPDLRLPRPPSLPSVSSVTKPTTNKTRQDTSPPAPLKARSPSPQPEPMAVDEPQLEPEISPPSAPNQIQSHSKTPPLASGSETEPDDDAEIAPPPATNSKRTSRTLPSSSPANVPPTLTARSKPLSSTPSTPPRATSSKAAGSNPDSDASPPPKKKAKPKPKLASSSDGDGDEAPKRGSAAVKRGTRQPIKRGGRRF